MAELKTLLAMQLGGSSGLLSELATVMTEAEWRSRPHPRANRLRFVVYSEVRAGLEQVRSA